jgi:pyrimidine 5'-nucleotidase
MRSILLLDFDHTLYPSTLPTLKAVDERITLYIQTHLGLSWEEADRRRVLFCEEYGTTLRGLEIRHGVDREHYCDFIHAVEAHHLPPPDPALHDWLARVPHPCYIFTNARMDWAVRGLMAMGLEGILPEVEAVRRHVAAPAAPTQGASAPVERDEAAPRTPWPGPRLKGILDIAFMEWQGKPHADAYAKADRHLRGIHGRDIRVHFADDRPDNLMAARDAGWKTIWITPEPRAAAPWGASFDRVAASLTSLDPETLS